MTHQPKRMAILVGGGPAPGINSVIGAATIRGILSGSEVIGVRDGFKWIMRGNIDNITPLTIDQVSRIHFRGGSYIGIAILLVLISWAVWQSKRSALAAT